MKALKCAVVLADGMTTVIWGSSVAPEGWDVLYSGAVIGASNLSSNPLDRICLDENFDSSTPRIAAIGDLLPVGIRNVIY